MEERTSLFTNFTDQHKTSKRKDYGNPELMKKIISASPFGIIVYDDTGSCVFLNDTASEITGIPAERILGKKFHETEIWKTSGMLEAANFTLYSGHEEYIQICIDTAFEKDMWLDCRFEKFIYKEKPHLLLFFNDIAGKKRFDTEIFRKNNPAFIQFYG
jgi:PAS domain S-box-containing protein